MNTERWREIEAIFEGAVDLDGNERTDFLEKSCHGDQDLRREVESLLTAGSGCADAVQQAVRTNAEELALEHTQALVGQKIGPYRILELIGRGGMGAVYLAVRDDDFNKQVAIKLINHGMASDVIVSRFRRERQILALLEHPYIAHLHDGGTTRDGRPYFVMEYVEGRPITEFCAQNQLGMRDRVALFRRVCEAVQHAHRNLIVHRDIKPGNILVTQDGTPKLLDFGLAKLLDPALDAEQTGTFVRMLTPHYASPEQIRGEPATAATDIYSLGAVLYELLAGRRVHETAGRSIAEIEQAICQREPDRPGRINRALAGDLDNILLTALRTDPARRYRSVEHFSEDLRRYLSGLPVTARQDSVWYRIGKFVRRNRASVATSAIALLSTVTGIGIAVWPVHGPAPLQVRPITALPGTEGWPDLSPDGKKVVFTWKHEDRRNASLYVMAVDGGSVPVQLTNGEATTYDWSPAWSSDGLQIAFRRERSIYLVSASGGPERRLADDPQASSHLSWSPDGKWLATARYPAAYSKPAVVSEMALISTETGERKLLSRRDPPAFDDTPVFSADGRRLAYMACRNGSDCTVVIQNIDPKSGLTGEPLRLPASGEMHSRLAWSPDQQWIVYSRVGPGVAQGLWRVSANGRGTAERLPLPGERFTSPSFARQGNRLIVVLEHLDIDILRISLNSGLPPTSTAPPSRWAWSTRSEQRPDFSPDGTKVAFVSSRAGTSDLWLANAGGDNAVQLTDHFGSAEGSPKWSPDGLRIAFTSFQGGNPDIWIMDADGGRKRRLTQWPTMEADPVWSRDGSTVYFWSDRTGTPEIWRVRSAGGDPEQMTTQGGWIACESADGTLLYYTKQPSSPLFVKPLRGGAERQILDWVHQRSFVVTADGIYFVGRRDTAKNIAPLSFYDFRSGKTWVIRAIGANPAAALALSPDHRTVLLPVFDPADGNPSSDLMLIENFH